MVEPGEFYFFDSKINKVLEVSEGFVRYVAWDDRLCRWYPGIALLDSSPFHYILISKELVVRHCEDCENAFQEDEEDILSVFGISEDEEDEEETN